MKTLIAPSTPTNPENSLVLTEKQNSETASLSSVSYYRKNEEIQKPSSGANLKELWQTFVRTLKKNQVILYSILRHSVFGESNGNKMTFFFNDTSNGHFCLQRFLDKKDIIEELFQKFSSYPYTINTEILSFEKHNIEEEEVDETALLIKKKRNESKPFDKLISLFNLKYQSE